MSKKHVIEITAVVLVVGALIMGGRANRSSNLFAGTQDEVAAFYNGKIIKWIIPYSPGGGYDEYARLIAPLLSKHTGARVNVFNMPGAGGMRGVNELFTSPDNGLILGMINGSALVTNELAGIEGIMYELDEFEYIGRIVADSRVFVLANTSGLSTFDDILNSPRPFKRGATGLGGSTYVDAVVSKEAFGLNVQIVHGFDSSSIVRQAMLRGNIIGTWGSYGSAEESVDTGAETIVLQSGKQRHPDLQHIPTVFEYAHKAAEPDRARAILTAWSALIEVGRSIAAPPGTPVEKLEFLRQAFRKSMHDPELLTMVEKTGRPLDYLDGDEIARITHEATVMPPHIRELFVRIIRGELQSLSSSP
jgi:tripartite-type tricarboxylate transporter receptor subunit TctC